MEIDQAGSRGNDSLKTSNEGLFARAADSLLDLVRIAPLSVGLLASQEFSATANAQQDFANQGADPIGAQVQPAPEISPGLSLHTPPPIMGLLNRLPIGNWHAVVNSAPNGPLYLKGNGSAQIPLEGLLHPGPNDVPLNQIQEPALKIVWNQLACPGAQDLGAFRFHVQVYVDGQLVTTDPIVDGGKTNGIGLVADPFLGTAITTDTGAKEKGWKTFQAIGIVALPEATVNALSWAVNNGVTPFMKLEIPEGAYGYYSVYAAASTYPTAGIYVRSDGLPTPLAPNIEVEIGNLEALQNKELAPADTEVFTAASVPVFGANPAPATHPAVQNEPAVAQFPAPETHPEPTVVAAPAIVVNVAPTPAPVFNIPEKAASSVPVETRVQIPHVVTQTPIAVKEKENVSGAGSVHSPGLENEDKSAGGASQPSADSQSRSSVANSFVNMPRFVVPVPVGVVNSVPEAPQFAEAPPPAENLEALEQFTFNAAPKVRARLSPTLAGGDTATVLSTNSVTSLTSTNSPSVVAGSPVASSPEKSERANQTKTEASSKDSKTTGKVGLEASKNTEKLKN